LALLGESVCPYCGVGCRLRVEGDETGVTRIRGVEAAPANLGRLCAKGAQLGPTINTADRARVPLIRQSRSTGLTQSTWDESLDHVATQFRRIIAEHGPDAVAFYGSGQLDSESAYLVGKLFKGFLGTNNTDSNSRLCMAAAVAGYRSSLGADGPPTCYDDIDQANVVLVIGSNMAEAHPVTFDRLRNSKKERPEQQIIVVDPRRTATCAIADLHIPLAPGSDIAFLNAVGRLIVQNGGADEHFIGFHTKGFVEYVAFLMSQPLDEMVALASVPRTLIEQVARLIGKSRAFLSFYCMGVNQSTVGMWKNNSIINLHLLTGQIGKPGAGPFSLTGQPNAMGGRECGLLSHQLPGYRFVEDAKHRTEVEHFWGRPIGSMSPRNGLSAVEMFQALDRGTLKAIWIAGTNPMVSMPDLHSVRRGLAKAELVVVSDAYHPTETTRIADVVLPVASWGEKETTSTNSERMVARSPKMWDAPGEALPDWQVLCAFAAKMGFANSFDYASGSQVWDEFIRLTRGRPCDMYGITSSRLNDGVSLQWPCPDAYHYGTKRRYLDQVFPTTDGKAVFLPRDHREPFEPTDDQFPFVLTTGRIYAHWHTLTRTAKAEKLMARDPAPYVEMAFEDADRLDVADGDAVKLRTRRGEIVLPARREVGMRPGTVFVPFHWGDLFGEGNALNYLTVPAFGPVEKQPELKFCAANVAKVRPVRETRTALELVDAN
jgi:anaerobic selenocysteine-containing dehydrogenase